MSELININDNRTTIRWKLLTGVSALTLAVYVSSANVALAGDADHPPIWIELGGQLSILNDSEEKITAPFYTAFAGSGLDTPLKFENPPRFSIDEYSKLSFRPTGSEWNFSASVRYGRSSTKKNTHQETQGNPIILSLYGGSYYYKGPVFAKRFSDTQWGSTEKHAVLDFQAGKDVGLGLFGSSGVATVDLGIRFAQFQSKSQVGINADPNMNYPARITQYSQYVAFRYIYFHKTINQLSAENQNSFRGIGPSLSWQGSAPIAGNADSSEISVDWGINAAVLFGRQKAHGHHQTSSAHCGHNGFFGILCDVGAAPTQFGPYVTHDRSRNVTVPNIGGAIGLSFKSGDAKVSFGYRADMFMGAMDTGIDVAKKSNMLFHGPYASISIGLGD